MWEKKFADIAATAEEKKRFSEDKLSGISSKMKADRSAALKHANDVIKPIFKQIILAATKVGYKAKTEAPSIGIPPIAYLLISNGKTAAYEKHCVIKITHYSGLSFALQTISPESTEDSSISIDDLDKEKIESIVEKLLAETFN